MTSERKPTDLAQEYAETFDEIKACAERVARQTNDLETLRQRHKRLGDQLSRTVGANIPLKVYKVNGGARVVIVHQSEGVRLEDVIGVDA